ncbi:hypothetical protein N7523_009572 [Penicillium sp. IBT 18751x]|nr:hypothetical protein N7523_009572 [Penicillium sp. IBT 18751x]
MPVPTAEQYDREQANARQVASAGHVSTDNSSDRQLGTGTGATVNAPGSSLSQDASALSKEEADRLFEERMEEEYAKREGGA